MKLSCCTNRATVDETRSTQLACTVSKIVTGFKMFLWQSASSTYSTRLVLSVGDGAAPPNTIQ